MLESIKLAFQSDLLTIKISDIRPLKGEITPAERNHPKYKQIASTVTHIGLVEPLIVFPDRKGKYLLVDGHKRLDILSQNGAEEVECLVATDDETYTYNKRVNYLPPIGEHCMILKALANGVTELRIAEALNVDVAVIRRKRDLLNGICPEVAELLKTKRVTAAGFGLLRKMKPVRQIKCGQLMVSASNYTLAFIKAFLNVTPDELLVTVPTMRRSPLVPNGKKTLLEQEAAALIEDLKHAEESYGTDMLDLSTCCRYFSRLLRNARINRYLSKNHGDILAELDQLIASVEQESPKPIASEANGNSHAANQNAD